VFISISITIRLVISMIWIIYLAVVDFIITFDKLSDSDLWWCSFPNKINKICSSSTTTTIIISRNSQKSQLMLIY